MTSARSMDLRRRCFGWCLVVLALLFAPTGLGRGMLLVLAEGACPPDCTGADEHEEGDEGHAHASRSSDEAALDAVSEERTESEHPCAWQGERERCPSDCDDCSCCATPTVAVLDIPMLTFGMLEAFEIDRCGPPRPARTPERLGLFRPPKHAPATVEHHVA